jgi:predicted regulator of Ras-like GTPase activity (Roadblock/LC7/MglB family)
MIEVLEPLTRIAGVRCALLISPDGVPVIARGKLALEGSLEGALDTNADALAGLAAGWLNGLSTSVAPLSWEAPARLALRCARGTLVLCTVTGAILLVVLDTGASSEELRLPMEAAVARMRRILRCARAAQAEQAAPEPAPQAPLPHPAPSAGASVKGPAAVHADTSSKQSPREFPG